MRIMSVCLCVNAWIVTIRKKNVWWGDPSTWNFGSTGPGWSEIADFEPIIASSTSAVTPSPKGGSKTQNCRSPSKIALRLKKICYKVSLCDNRQGQSCRTFIGLTNRAKMIGGDVPFYLQFWVKVTALERNRRFFLSIFSRRASAKKVQLTLIGSPLRTFQWAQDEHHTLSLSPQRVAQ